jgi:hypothetical protein
MDSCNYLFGSFDGRIVRCQEAQVNLLRAGEQNPAQPLSRKELRAGRVRFTSSSGTSWNRSQWVSATSHPA